MTAENPPERLELGVGQEHEIELAGLGTAGYVWEHDLDGDSGAVEVTWRRGLPAGAARSTAVGASAPEVAIIRALRPGHVTLHVMQRRPWERDKPPLRSHRVELIIT